MKALLLTVLAMVGMAIGLAACGGDDDSTDATAVIPTRGAVSPTAGTAVSAEERAIAAITTPKELADGATLGQKTAKVTLTLFEDFQCPFCLRFTASYDALIVDEYVKTGKVRLEFKHFPILGAESIAAAGAGVCAASGNAFWPFHNRLFLEQAKAGQVRSEKLNIGRFSAENLRTYAIDAGMNAAAYDSCIKDPATLAKVQEDQKAGQSLGIRGTPGVVVNGTAQSIPASAAELRKLLDDAVTAAR